jgi:hypothetical protein
MRICWKKVRVVTNGTFSKTDTAGIQTFVGKGMKKISILILGTFLLLVLWFLTEMNDYFRTDYRDLTETEEAEFRRESDPTMIYVSHFGDDKYIFPRQNVDKIKLFINKPFIATLTSKTLKQEFKPEIINFFNDSTNFHWSETTWSYRESEYILRFYNDGTIVGKIYLCLDKCGMTETRPFTPNVKFGGLTDEAQKKLESIIVDRQKWK